MDRKPKPTVRRGDSADPNLSEACRTQRPIHRHRFMLGLLDPWCGNQVKVALPAAVNCDRVPERPQRSSHTLDQLVLRLPLPTIL